MAGFQEAHVHSENYDKNPIIVMISKLHILIDLWLYSQISSSNFCEKTSFIQAMKFSLQIEKFIINHHFVWNTGFYCNEKINNYETIAGEEVSQNKHQFLPYQFRFRRCFNPRNKLSNVCINRWYSSLPKLTPRSNAS